MWKSIILLLFLNLYFLFLDWFDSTEIRWFVLLALFSQEKWFFLFYFFYLHSTLCWLLYRYLKIFSSIHQNIFFDFCVFCLAPFGTHMSVHLCQISNSWLLPLLLFSRPICFTIFVILTFITKEYIFDRIKLTIIDDELSPTIWWKKFRQKFFSIFSIFFFSFNHNYRFQHQIKQITIFIRSAIQTW